MTDPCAQRNPLVRSGLTQEGRKRAELRPDHFQPDERDLADMVLFGQRFARHIKYYDATNTQVGDWTAFFESDVTASLAALAKLPVDAFRGFQLDLENWLKARPGRDKDQLAAHFKLWFHLPVVLLEIAGRHHGKLPVDHPFVPQLIQLAARDLADPLTRLIGWHKGALPGGADAVLEDTAIDMADYNTAGGADDRVRLSSTVAAAIAGHPAFSVSPEPGLILSRIPPGTWSGLYTATAADDSPYVDAAGSPNQRYEQIYDALTYNLLTTAVERIYQGMERVRRDALGQLAASLESFAGHAPHYGLWLTFLQLFQRARRELNQFTGRHLDFYFREVLRLGARAAVPDKAHLLFELAKGRETALLTAGTLFRAGKDALGRPVSYALENDIVVNRGKVAELRAMRIETSVAAGKTAQLPLAAAVARSRDGLGEVELAKDDPTWPPFGPDASPAARVGFAIADRKLFLREGSRTIRLRAILKSPVSDTGIAPRWRVRLTGDEGWFEMTGTARISTEIDNSHTEPVEDEDDEPAMAPPAKGGKTTPPKTKGAKNTAKDSLLMKQFGAMGSEKSFVPGKTAQEQKIAQQPAQQSKKKKPEGKPLRIIEITVTLSPEDPPIVPLDAKLHGEDHAPGVPVMEVIHDFDAASTARAFAVLRNIRASEVSLVTEAEGLKNLTVVAGGGVADAAKPFAPFGPQPPAGAFFTIGSSEIFSKRIADWDLTLDWLTTYSSSSYFRSRTADSYNPVESVLTGGKWKAVPSNAKKRIKAGRKRPTLNTNKADLHLGEKNATLDLRSSSLIDGLAEQTLENPPLDAKSVTGFMRMALPADFGHAAFPAENARALIGLAGDTTYSPSSGVNTYKSGSGNSAPLLPYAPYDPVVTRIEASYETTRDPVEGFVLLHPFGVSAGSADGRLFPEFPFEGALLVGVADFDSPARLTLLVQVADGSGDPLKKAPDLQFSFLDGDAWTAFDPQDVDDKTNDFTGSGVLGLNLPEEADTAHNLLPAGLRWIRIAATHDADALNRLLSVDAQAARVVFADAGNDPAFLETPLPAGSISKLAAPDLAIKKIVQPYSSFDGRPVERPDAFATRVSERLRHKDRAVTMFDYEALVLEAFPRLYRVRCLGTTELKRSAANVIIADNEMMPGAVTVVTVPWTHGQNARDPLRPYTDQATLTAVDAFLRKRVSPFVRLEVQNPKFEEVQVDFKVRFRPEIGDIAFYKDELNKAVIDFLTPWARPGGGEIAFGGKLWKSSIIDFVEERSEVDYVIDFRLFHKVDIDAPAGGWTPVDVETVEATTARSILVSAARHSIAEVPGNA
ncbi:MAG: hypothetical protein AB7O49_01350 [Sphingomonadales bacterium]